MPAHIDNLIKDTFYYGTAEFIQWHYKIFYLCQQKYPAMATPQW